jgi:hypothetical protein
MKKKVGVKREKKGRNTNQLQFLQKDVMRQVWKHQYAWPFHKPVDAAKLNIPDYYDIIKQPMDLGLIKKKLDMQDYMSAKECIEDFKLVFNNCYYYNKPGEDVVVMAEAVHKFFNERLAMMPPEEYEIIPSSQPVVKKATSTHDTPAAEGEPSAKREKRTRAQATAADSTQPNLTSHAPEMDFVNSDPSAIRPPPFPSDMASLPVSSMLITSTESTPVQPIERTPNIVKSGVKRKKADTTTPAMPVAGESLVSPLLPAKIPVRRESSQRKTKKPVKDLPI